MKETSSFKHQGDVTFIKNELILTGELEKHDGNFVLALGEHTGHKHVITVERPEDMKIQKLGFESFLISLLSSATITHEEHKPIVIEPGTYRVGKERELDHFSKVTRSVVD